MMEAVHNQEGGVCLTSRACLRVKLLQIHVAAW